MHLLPHSLSLSVSWCSECKKLIWNVSSMKNEIKTELLHYFSLKLRTCAVCTRRSNIMTLSCWRYFPLNIIFLCICVYFDLSHCCYFFFFFLLWLNVFLCCCCLALVRSVSRSLRLCSGFHTRQLSHSLFMCERTWRNEICTVSQALCHFPNLSLGCVRVYTVCATH